MQPSDRTRSPLTLISYLLIGLVALLPRTLDLGQFITSDEASFWLQRSEVFLDAMRRGNYAATAMTTHPGVTTMWLGAGGILLRSWLLESGWLTDTSFTTRLALMQLLPGLVHTLAVVVGYGLLRRLFHPLLALLAAILWACDPFVLAYSRVLHVDGLMGSFASVSLLAACVYVYADQRWRWWLLSGVAAGLGVLSKSPALALIPTVGLMLLHEAWYRAASLPADQPIWRRWLLVSVSRATVVSLLVWGGLLVATIVIGWPALWVSPIQAYEQVRVGVEVEGAVPHMLGNFFLGRGTEVPGWMIYPLTIPLRLTPWSFIGLLALLGLRRQIVGVAGKTLGALTLFTLIFTAAMSLFPKQFNRYLMPVFPALDVLAAFGLLGLVSLMVTQPPLRQRLQAGVVVLVTLLGLLNLRWYHPYQIAYFNQLFGGPAIGAYAFQIGWGEGLEQVAAWLNQQPDITGVKVLTTTMPTLQPYLRPGAQSLTVWDAPIPDKTGYVVVYVRHTQSGELGQPFRQFYQNQMPLHTVTIHGVPYAWIYQVAPPVAQERPAQFGAALQLRGVDPQLPAQPGQPLVFQLFWQRMAAPLADRSLFIHVINQQGQRVAQADIPYPFGGWEAGRYYTTEALVGLPAELPSGAYRVFVGLYDPASGAREPVRTTLPLEPAVSGPDAIPLFDFSIIR